MYHRIRILPIISGLLLFSVLLVACQPNPVQVTQEVEVTRQVEVTKEVPVVPVVTEEPIKLVIPGKLTIGFAPSVATTETVNDEVVGVVADIMRDVAARMGLEPVFKAYDFPALIPALQSGRVDMIATGFSATQPRAQILYFVTPWLMAPETLVVKPGTQLSSWEQARDEGLTLASTRGYFQLGAWESMGINTHTFDTDEACWLDVENGGAAGCATSLVPFLVLSATQPDSTAAQLTLVPMSGPQISTDLNAFAVNKDNPALAQAISKHVTDMWREGKIEEDYRASFGTSPYDIFLNPPAGSAMYLVGPWEEGVTPPASEVYSPITTITESELTVGIVSDSPMLKLTGDQLSGPEADTLQFIASKLGLSLKGIQVSDAAAAVRDGTVDLIAGALPATEEGSHQYWQSLPIGFSPDYIYVRPSEGGAYPAYKSWEDVVAANGKLAVVTGNPRTEDIRSSGAEVVEVSDAVAGLQALIDGTAQGFVASTIDYCYGASSDSAIADAGIGWVLNINTKSQGAAYIWGVKAGNGQLLDALNQGLTAAWQQKVIANIYAEAFPGANVTSLLGPGPTAVGTSYSFSKDYQFRAMWTTGAWLQRPDWVR